MPKPAKVENNIRSWLAEQGAGNLAGFVRCHSASVSMVMPNTLITVSASSSDPRWAAGLLGRELADNKVLLGHTRALVLTEDSFFVLRLSGWHERVKALEIEVDSAPIKVHYTDAKTSHGFTARYFVVDLPNGEWLLDSLVIAKKNGKPGPFAATADRFLVALGERAHRIEYDPD